jgi:hypothetical protein
MLFNRAGEGTKITSSPKDAKPRSRAKATIKKEKERKKREALVYK